MAFIFNGVSPTAINFNGSPVYTLICNGVTVWTAAVTVTYYVDSGTSYQESVVYGNSVLSPTSFTPSKSGYTFVGWRENNTASSSVLSSKTMGTDPISLYAVFKKTVTLTYYNNSTTASTTSGTQYYNNGNVSNPTFTLSQASKSGWTARGWATGTAGNASVAYSSISGTAFSANTTVYGLYQQTITLSYNGNGSTSGSTSSQTGTRYYNSYGNYSNPSFTLASNGFAKTSYSFSKWAQGSTSGTQYAAGASVTLSASTTFYAIWSLNAFYWFRAVDPGDGSDYKLEFASGYPTTWSSKEYECDECSSGDSWYPCRFDCSEGHSNSNKVSASSGGHTKARIYVSQISSATLKANSTSITSRGTYEVDVSSGTLALELEWGGGGYIYLDYVYFYS